MLAFVAKMGVPMKKIITFLILFLPLSTQSAVLNGTFDNASDWVDASLSGTAGVDSGVAVLATAGSGDTGAFSSSLAQGTDSFFFNFTSTTVVDGTWLNFDFFFDNSFVDIAESGPAGADYFAVTLLTQADFDNFLPGLSFTGDLDFFLTASFAALDVSSYVGETVVISFDLHDQADQRDSVLKLDNVEFSDSARTGALTRLAPQVAAVPEPPFVLLFFSAALLFGRQLMDGYQRLR